MDERLADCQHLWRQELDRLCWVCVWCREEQSERERGAWLEVMTLEMWWQLSD